MSKEKKLEEHDRKLLLDELKKMPPMVIATAYLHAINYTKYGVDVTEKWVTAVQNASALEKAYGKGYYDALLKTAKQKLEIENVKSAIDALPRIKVGNSNSPTVKYCIDEQLLYEVLEGIDKKED